MGGAIKGSLTVLYANETFLAVNANRIVAIADEWLDALTRLFPLGRCVKRRQGTKRSRWSALLTPVRIPPADLARTKLAALNLSESDMADAVTRTGKRK